VRALMKHSWFTTCADWNWKKLKAQQSLPPWGPDPKTLPAPFRNEDLSHDITNQRPLTFAEFHNSLEDDSYTNIISPSFEGFKDITRPGEFCFSNNTRAHALEILEQNPAP